MTLIAGGALAWWHWMIPPTPSNRPQMWFAAEDIVRATLKAPSTASFPWRGRSYTEFHSGWVLVGDVDAENSFGAKLRARWEVTITKQPGGGWACDWIEIDGPEIVQPLFRSLPSRPK